MKIGKYTLAYQSIVESVQLTIDNQGEVKKWCTVEGLCRAVTYSRPPLRAITGISILYFNGMSFDIPFGTYIYKNSEGNFYPMSESDFKKYSIPV